MNRRTMRREPAATRHRAPSDVATISAYLPDDPSPGVIGQRHDISFPEREEVEVTKAGCTCCGAACQCPACSCDEEAIKAGQACDCCGGATRCTMTKAVAAVH